MSPVVSRNQHTAFTLPAFVNSTGSHGHVASITNLTMKELYRRGGVIEDSTGCHAWTRAKLQKWQYGVINLRVPGHDKSKSHYAHRLVLHLTGAMAYDDLRHALHSCHKPWCVNPQHLRPGTNAENAHDRYERNPKVRVRPSHDTTWFRAAQVVALRSECVRRQAGCVLVGHDRRVVASGFNGKPDRLTVSGPCSEYCPRASTGGGSDYSDCLFIHAEMNALMYSDRTLREGGTAYVTSCPCLGCAQALANSGISRVVCAVGVEDVNRNPEKSIKLMMDSGLRVEIHYEPHIQSGIKNWGTR